MKRLLLLPVLLLLLSGPASATAKSMPAPRDNEIVVPFSIAGVKPGMKPSAALQAWGDPGKECSGGASEKFSTCQWGDPYGTTGMATFGSGVTGKVDAISPLLEVCYRRHHVSLYGERGRSTEEDQDQRAQRKRRLRARLPTQSRDQGLPGR